MDVSDKAAAAQPAYDFLTNKSISEDGMIFRHSGTRRLDAASQNQDAELQIKHPASSFFTRVLLRPTAGGAERKDLEMEVLRNQRSFLMHCLMALWGR